MPFSFNLVFNTAARSSSFAWTIFSCRLFANCSSPSWVTILSAYSLCLIRRCIWLDWKKGLIRLESIRESGQTYAQRSRTTIHEGVIGQRHEWRIGQGILLLYPTGDALSPGHKDRLLVLHPEYYLD